MISDTSSQALSSPASAPQAAPARAAASAMTVNTTAGGSPSGSQNDATPVAAQAPSSSCPSAPTFHSRARKATAQPSPHKSSGVALTVVSDRA